MCIYIIDLLTARGGLLYSLYMAKPHFHNKISTGQYK